MASSRDQLTRALMLVFAGVGSVTASEPAYSPAVSPDGRTVAVVTGDKVWLVGRDGNLQLFPHGMKQQRPAFSPDGTKVALVMCNQFAMDSSGEVFVVEIKTKGLTPLRTGAGASLMPDPSSRLNWIE